MTGFHFFLIFLWKGNPTTVHTHDTSLSKIFRTRLKIFQTRGTGSELTQQWRRVARLLPVVVEGDEIEELRVVSQEKRVVRLLSKAYLV